MTGGEIKMTIDEKIAKIDQREIAGVCSASVSTLPSRRCGSTLAAIAAKPGAIWRHGPHHPARKSIRSGISLNAVCFSKFAEVNSTGCPRNNGLPHFPQRPPSVARQAYD